MYPNMVKFCFLKIELTLFEWGIYVPLVPKFHFLRNPILIIILRGEIEKIFSMKL